MAVPDFHLCDVCGAKCKRGFFVVTGRETDAAGSSDDVGADLDLCEGCAVECLSRMAMRLQGSVFVADEERGKELLAWVRRMKK